MTLRYSVLTATLIGCISYTTLAVGEQVVADEAPSRTSLYSTAALSNTSYIASLPAVDQPLAVEGRACDLACDCDLVVPGWQVGVELLHYTPRLRGVDYAALDYGNSLALGTGAIQRLEYDDDVGYRAGVGYLTRTGWGVAVQLTTIDFGGFDQVERPAGAGQLFATRTHPDSNQEADTASAEGALDFRYVDLLVSRTCFANRFSRVDVFGGLRWAEIDQQLVFNYGGRDFLEGVVQQQQATNAFGLRLGSTAEWRLAGGFGLVGNCAGSLMHGRFETHNLETNLDGQQLMAEMSDDYDDLVSVLDVGLGVSWHYRWLRIQAVYELSGWYNANNRGLYVDDQHEGIYAPFSNDILLQGYSIRLVGQW